MAEFGQIEVGNKSNSDHDERLCGAELVHIFIHSFTRCNELN